MSFISPSLTGCFDNQHFDYLSNAMIQKRTHKHLLALRFRICFDCDSIKSKSLQSCHTDEFVWMQITICCLQTTKKNTLNYHKNNYKKYVHQAFLSIYLNNKWCNWLFFSAFIWIEWKCCIDSLQLIAKRNYVVVAKMLCLHMLCIQFMSLNWIHLCDRSEFATFSNRIVRPSNVKCFFRWNSRR